MRVSEASRCFLDYHRMNSKENTIRNYELVSTRFCSEFGDRELGSISPDEILAFLTQLTEGTKQSTRRLRYCLLSALFNFVKNSLDPKFENPSETPILRKLFKDPKPNHWDILEKEVVDEMVFRTENPRNRLMLELMARGDMRAGEVLSLTPRDIEERKIIIRDPKSGREAEVVFIPQKVADRLKEYISRVDRGLPWLQADVCFLRLPPGFPAVPPYLSHTFGCSPAPHRTGQVDFPYIRLFGQSFR